MAIVNIMKYPLALGSGSYEHVTRCPIHERVLWICIDGFDFNRPAHFRNQGWRLVRVLLSSAEKLDKTSTCEAVRLLRRQMIQQAWNIRVTWRSIRPAGLYVRSRGGYRLRGAAS